MFVRCFAYQFNVDYRVTMLLVLWALGWAMITLAALVRLPIVAVTAFGLLLIAGHNLLDSVRRRLVRSGPFCTRPGFVLNTPDHVVFVAYPLIPWIGVTAVGLRPRTGLRVGCRSPPRVPAAHRDWHSSPRFCRSAASTSTATRLPGPSQPTVGFTVLSFLNMTKYPPSLLFLLMTLGPALLFLRAVDRRTPRMLRPALVIGKVPLFYYVLHFVLIHLLAVATCYVRYGSAHWMFESPDLGELSVHGAAGLGILAAGCLRWCGQAS